jgi:hypothetical protein
MLEAFKENPVFFLLACLLGVAAVAAGLVGLFVVTRQLRVGVGVVALGLGLSALGAGAGGTLVARGHVDAAALTPGLSARDSDRIRDIGYRESAQSLVFGSLAAVPGSLLAVIALVSARKR